MGIQVSNIFLSIQNQHKVPEWSTSRFKPTKSHCGTNDGPATISKRVKSTRGHYWHILWKYRNSTSASSNCQRLRLKRDDLLLFLLLIRQRFGRFI